MAEKVTFSGFWWNYCTERYNREYRRVLMELVEPNPEAAYLDLGCGDGKLATKVASHIGTKYIHGVDVNVPLVHAKGIKFRKRDLDKGLSWYDNVFNVVTASQIIEHVCDTDLLLKEIYRVLKPGGYADISTNNLAAAHWIILFLMGRQPPTACIGDEMYGTGKMHRRLFTMPGLVAAAKYFNFKIEQVVGTYYFPFPVPIARMMCKIDRRHATCVTIKARKPV